MNSTAERSQVIELAQTLPDEQIHYVLQIIQSLPQRQEQPSRCKLRGRFSDHADPTLRTKEKEAWAMAAEEKHGLR